MAAAPAPASFASAPIPDGVPRATVRYADLDLTTNAGAAALLRRIKAAAKQVCGDPFDFGNLAQKARVRRCHSEAVARAVSGVQATKLTELYREQNSTARLD